MEAEPEQFVIADLLDNAIEPWDDPPAHELDDSAADQDDQPVPIVIAAYRNEHGAVLIDGAQQLQWLARSPRNRTHISADDVTVEPAAVDEDSAHLAAVKHRIGRRPAPARVKAELALRLQARFGWSKATIAEALHESRPVVANWIKQMGGADIAEAASADGTIYPARGKRTVQGAAAGGSVADALRVLRAEHEQAMRKYPPIRLATIDRRGSADPKDWKVTIPASATAAAAQLAAGLREQAEDLVILARKLSQAPGAARNSP